MNKLKILAKHNIEGVNQNSKFEYRGDNESNPRASLCSISHIHQPSHTRLSLVNLETYQY